MCLSNVFVRAISYEVTYSKNEYDEYGGASYSNYLLDAMESDISIMVSDATLSVSIYWAIL